MNTFRSAVMVALLCALTTSAGAQTIAVDTTPGHVKNSFSPARALGAGIDRIPTRTVEPAFQPEVLKQVLAAGWRPVSYRSNTELFVEAWHRNPKGTWSDPAGRGYFVGSTELAEPIRYSFGYPLPH